MDNIIDFAKVDKAFHYLGHTNDGGKTLEQFAQSIESLKSSVQPRLNDQEFKYLLTNLANQRGAKTTSPEAVTKSGFLIKSAVD